MQVYLPVRQGSNVDSPKVSPDHKHILYYDAEMGNNWQAVITDDRARVIWSTALGISENYGWFDNQRIWHYLAPATSDGKTSPQFSLLNPFNGTQRTLQTDFPSMKPMNNKILNYLWSAPELFYDPTLKRVVYAACFEDVCGAIAGHPGSGPAAVLYDLETEEVVKSLLTQENFGTQPIWLSDGSAFIMASHPANFTGYEFFSVNRDGEIRQLTHISDSFSKYDLSMNYALSPNEHFLAFWLNVRPGSADDVLAILDLHNGDIINYCIPGASWLYKSATELSEMEPGVLNDLSPVWSLDGEQLAIMSLDPDFARVKPDLSD